MNKEYIIKLDFGGTNYYLQFLPDGKVNEIYNPHFATTFPSEKVALESANEKTTFGEYSKAVDFKTTCDNFDKWAAEGMIRRTFAPISSISRKYNGENRMEVLNWWSEYRNSHAEGKEGEIRHEDYKTWPALNGMFSHIFDSNCISKDRYGKIQPSFRMWVSKDSDFGIFKEELSFIVDKVGAFDDGEKLISILDEDLAASGVPYFVIKPNDKYAIRYFSWGRWRKDTIEGSLEEVFEHWRHNNYYDR